MSWAGSITDGNRSHSYGWLSMGHTQNHADGDTELEHLTILSKTTINEMTKGLWDELER